MFGETQIYGYSDLPLSIFTKLDSSGQSSGYGSILTIILDLISVYQEVTFTESATNDFRADKYKQIMILLEQAISTFRTIDYNDETHRTLSAILTSYVALGGVAEHPYAYHLLYENYSDIFGGFRPNEFDRIKFNMEEENSVFDNVVFSDFDANSFSNTAIRKIVPLQDITIIVP